MTPDNAGRFITLEGGEGVGKSTQADRLAAALRQRGKSVVVTREPGGTPGAEAIRALLMTGNADRWSARVEALLFAAARADHVERVIRPALSRGEWVVCDRYVDSTRAYQGGAGGVDDADIVALHDFGTDGLMPVRTLLLVLDADAAATRVVARGDADRFGAKGATYHARLAQAFERLATETPERFRTIDASGDVDDITRRMIDALDDLI